MMKTSMKRLTALCLSLIMALALAMSAFATDSSAITRLRASHPENSYYSTYYENGIPMAWECMGYAYQLMYEAFGTYLYNTRFENHNVSYLNNLKAGDVVRYAPRGIRHSIFITAVDGENVWYTDSNGRSGGKGYCIVDWDKYTTKSELRRTFCYATPGLWDLNPSSGQTAAPSISDPAALYNQFLPAKAMLLTSTRKDCYAGYGGAKVGRIYESDQVTIQEVKMYNGVLWCKLSCPWSENGRSYNKTVYAPLSYFVQNTSYTPQASTISGQYTTYWRTDRSIRAGYTGKGDTGLIVGQGSSGTQIFYPLTNGTYKLAFM